MVWLGLITNKKVQQVGFLTLQLLTFCGRVQEVRHEPNLGSQSHRNNTRKLEISAIHPLLTTYSTLRDL